MPYEPHRDDARFDRLIDAVNELTPAFTLHVGDTKSGKTSCDDAALEDILDEFDRFQAPLVYTPGDNEWRDCYKKKAARFAPLERLTTVRDMFFTKPESLGVATMPIERQADLMPDYASYVENARFMHEQVMVVTAHIVGWSDKLLKHNADIDDENGESLPSITRLKVYGDGEVHAVHISVDSSDPAIFDFLPPIVPENFD